MLTKNPLPYRGSPEGVLPRLAFGVPTRSRRRKTLDEAQKTELVERRSNSDEFGYAPFIIRDRIHLDSLSASEGRLAL